MFCQKCGKQLDDEAVMCPACGKETINVSHTYSGKKRTSSKGIWKLIIGIIFISNGLWRVGENLIVPIVFAAVGFGFISWWIIKNWNVEDE